MGCADSSIHHSSVLSQLSQQIKQRYRDTIAQDHIANLLELQAQTKYPTNIELSQHGLLWTPLHFCCRYDSPLCLDYFLKKTYINNFKLYLTLVNHQTAQGETCLHLCAVWGATKCFALLVRYGGLNLAIKDQVQKSIFNVVQDYNRIQIGQVLQKLRKRYGNVTRWNFQFLEEIHQLTQMQEKDFYEDLVNKILTQEDTQCQVNKQCQIQTQKLCQLKLKLQIQKQQIRQKLSLKQHSIALDKKSFKLKKKDKKHSSDQQSISSQNQQQPQSMSKLTINLIQKQQQVQQVHQQINMVLNYHIHQQILIQESKALEMLRVQGNQEVIREFNKFTVQIIAHKEEIDASIRETANKKGIGSSNHQSVKPLNKSTGSEDHLSSADMKNFHLLPKSIQQSYIFAKNKGHFIDSEFPHNQASLGANPRQSKHLFLLKSLVWLRPGQFLSQQFTLFDGIQPNDVKQGQLGVCYCLATISQLARVPNHIRSIFVFYDLQIGFYVLKFHQDAKIKYVVIDDYFPCNASSCQPLFTKPIGHQIWVLLIQKAWSKLVGSYFGAQKMTPDYFMQQLVGSPTFGAWFKDKTQKTKQVIKYSSLNYPIVLSTGDKKIQGIVRNHAYSLLKVYEYNGSFIYKVRNPWGRFEWNGCYGDHSPLWTNQLKQLCKPQAVDDGVFFVSQSELLYAFEYYSIAMIQNSSQYFYLQFESQPQQNVFFRFSLKHQNKFALKITQKFDRWVNDKNYQYSSVVFQLGRIQGDRVVFVSEGNNKCHFGGKSVYVDSDIFRQHQPGEYFVRVKMQWKNPKTHNSAVISIYGAQSIVLKQISDQQGVALWRKLLKGFILNKPLKPLNQIQYCMQWMKGQMVCYCRLKPQSKLKCEVNWGFNVKDLQNCKLAISKNQAEKGLSMVLDAQNSQSLGTLDRLVLSQNCRSGSVSIKTVLL